jgi:glucokinase
MSETVVVGVDVGGTKIAVLVTSPDGAVLGRATNASSVADQDGAADAIAAVIDLALEGAGARLTDVAIVGIGVPGRVDPTTGNVTLAVNLGWNDLALRDALERRLGRPCVIENDARAAAVGLHRRRVLGSADDIAYLAVGTGIAAGLILDGRLHRGARGLAGEIGHAILDPNGPVCACGQRGCLEAFVSGPAIARRAAEAIAQGRATSLAGTADAAAGRASATPNASTPADAATPASAGAATAPRPATTPTPASTLTARDVYEAAAAGDALACELVEDVGRKLAWAIHLLVMAYDVDRVVVGGGVSHAGEPFMDPIRRELERLRTASPTAGELLPAGVLETLPVGADAGAWGAVAIAQQALYGANPVSTAGAVEGGA